MKSPWIRRIALAFGAIVLLLVAVGRYLIATFDAKRTRQQAIDWMKTEHQRTLAIDGPIKLSVLPRLELKYRGCACPSGPATSRSSRSPRRRWRCR